MAFVLGLIFFIVISGLFYMGLFKKASIPGWKAFVPLYNSYLLCKLTFGSGWYILIFLIPIIGEIFYFFLNYKLALVFGKGVLYALGLIFLPIIFIPILGYGGSQYQGPLLKRVQITAA